MTTRRHKLFSYFGSKANVAHLYPRPIHPTIVEPFAGAANYSLRYYRRRVILHEIDPVIFGILDFLVKSPPRDILALPLIRLGEKVGDLKLPCQEARWLIGMMVNDGCSTPKNSMTRWARERPDTFWGKSRRARLSVIVERIKHWRVHHSGCWDAFDLHGKRMDVTWFIDPPYQGKPGECYKFGSDLIDYRRLGLKIVELAGQAIVCEGEGASWLPFRRFFVERSKLRKGKHEMIWTKGCLASAGLLHPELFCKDLQ